MRRRKGKVMTCERYGRWDYYCMGYCDVGDLGYDSSIVHKIYDTSKDSFDLALPHTTFELSSRCSLLEKTTSSESQLNIWMFVWPMPCSLQTVLWNMAVVSSLASAISQKSRTSKTNVYTSTVYISSKRSKGAWIIR